jgi:O-antigen/teichoic acid export membrane protein
MDIMTRNPITVMDRLEFLTGAAILSVILFGVATMIHVLVAKTDVRKKIQGGPIRWWIAALYFAGACIGTWLGPNDRMPFMEAACGMAAFGLVFGVIVGNLHGAIILARHEFGEISTLKISGMNEEQEQDFENPYAPPRG